MRIVCSYVELDAVPRPCVQPPKRFLCHAWNRPFHELVDNLLALECGQGMGLGTSHRGGAAGDMNGSMDTRLRLNETQNMSWMDVPVWIGVQPPETG